jgi:hypothetical protein
MTISKDLFLSILAMDAYNRGYGAGIDDPSVGTGLGVSNDSHTYHIGNATIVRDAEQLLDQGAAQAAGFYSVAYTLEEAVGEGPDQIADGTTIISYRGMEGMRKGWSGVYH